MKQTIYSDRWTSMAGRLISPAFVIIEGLGGILTTLEAWRRDRQQSMQFSRVATRILRDAGISEAERFIEVNRPFR